MKLIVCENYDEMSKEAGKIVNAAVKNNPEITLGLATGSTPVGLYKEMIKAYEAGEISFKKVKSFNLDEYCGLTRDNDQSYYYFMCDNLFNHIDIDMKNVEVPNCEVSDYQAECERYDKKIEDNGGIDIQILGIGNNGHIAFNEPEEELYAKTHHTPLTQSSIEANKRFFNSIDEVPTSALTMGIEPIMKARQIIILISGAKKHDALTKLLSGRITTACPATILNCHPNCYVIADKDAYNG